MKTFFEISPTPGRNTKTFFSTLRVHDALIQSPAIKLLTLICLLIIKTVIVPAQNVGIGTTTPQAKLDVNGQIRISGGSPGVGKVLTSDALGIGSWMDAAIHADAANFTGNGATASPLKLSQMGASSGQVLKWNGTNWAPAEDALGVGLILPWSGSASTGDPGSFAFTVNSLVQNTTAIAGKNTTAGASEGDGVYGESSSATGSGVYGVSKGGGSGVKGKGSTGIYADGVAYGVYARGNTAVEGISSYSGGYGIRGHASDATGVNYGVYGTSSSPLGYGVYGVATATGNTKSGVYGEGSLNGVTGKALYDGYGVFGIGASGTATNWGVYGQSYSQNGGIGAEGRAEAMTGATIGVKGLAKSSTGTGVLGVATHISGVNYGVYGETSSANGYGVYAVSPYQGVYSKATAFQGRAIMGEALADNSIAIFGKAINPNGTGVYGEGAKNGIYGLSANYGVFGTSTGFKGRAIFGEATGTNSVGVHGTATSSNSTGVWGEGDNQGVYGVSAIATGKGVFGAATASSGANFGVYGESSSATGYGVYGKAPFYGVYGISSGTNSYGVYGKATSTTGTGIYGEAQKIGVNGTASMATGTGVYGEAPKYGVFGYSTAASGYGVYGTTSTASGYGVYGVSTSSSGYGLYGESPLYGAYVKSTGITGRAIKAEATGASSIGVWGAALAESSTGVYGQGTNYDFFAAGPGVNYGEPSSIRWKTNIRAIPDPLAKIDRMRGVYFNWDASHGGQHDVGMIAEEVGKVLPEIVVYEKNGTDASGMDYSKLTPLLLEGIKALKAENDLLKVRLAEIENILKTRK